MADELADVVLSRDIHGYIERWIFHHRLYKGVYSLKRRYPVQLRSCPLCGNDIGCRGSIVYLTGRYDDTNYTNFM